MNAVELAYEAAKERYAQIGVDTQKALDILGRTRISFNAWQLDDVKGFLKKDTAMSGGILSTGGYPGVATNPDQLRQDKNTRKIIRATGNKSRRRISHPRIDDPEIGRAHV